MRSPAFARFDGFDPAVLDRQGDLGRARLRHFQVGAGWTRGEFSAAPLVRTRIEWCHVSTDLRFVGSGPASHHTLLLVLDSGDGSRLNGHPLETGSIVSYGPSTPLDGVMAADSRIASMVLPSAVLTEAILGPADVRLPEPVDGIVFLRPERWAVAALSQFLEDLQELATTEREFFNDDRSCASVETDALETFGAALVSGCRVPTAPPQSRARSTEIVARVEAWLAGLESGSAGERRSVVEMCQAVGVGRRTLERAFHDVLRLSPAEYIRIVGLNAARRALMAGRGGVSVTQAALDSGFWHLGRFSSSYRELFGELPSQTLARAALDQHAPERPRSEFIATG